jgi:flagellar biosynthesis/type III secretory pathway protein FliH
MTLSKTPFQRDKLLATQDTNSGSFVPTRATPPVTFAQTKVADSTPETQIKVDVVEEIPKITLAEHEKLLQDALKQAQEASEQAYEQGKQDAAQELKAMLDEEKVHLNKLCDSFAQLIDNKHTLYEPLKKLSLRLAELLVQGELTADSGYIDRLLQITLDAIDNSPHSHIELAINPEDHPLLGETIHRFNQIKWTHDTQLARGSVRAISNDIVVENLFTDRLHDLQKQLGLAVFEPLVLETNSVTQPEEAKPKSRSKAKPEPIPETETETKPRASTKTRAKTRTKTSLKSDASSTKAGSTGPNDQAIDS